MTSESRACIFDSLKMALIVKNYSGPLSLSIQMISRDRASGSNAKRERQLTILALFIILIGRRRSVRLGPKPTRKSCFGNAAFYFGNTVLKIT
jgi:hypothetical protein